jgi:type II secretory pathway component PulJ
LIEILIALVLFFIIVVVAVLLLKSSGRLWLKTTAKLAAFEDCLAVAGVIRQDIWSATVVSVEAGGNGLSLINADGEQIQYELVEKKVRRKKDKSSSFLTYDETITGLNFYDFLGTGVSFEVQTGGSSVFIFWVRCRGGG